MRKYRNAFTGRFIKTKNRSLVEIMSATGYVDKINMDFIKFQTKILKDEQESKNNK